jgi:integrase
MYYQYFRRAPKLVENRVEKDTQIVLADVAEAWAELPEDQAPIHEVHCVDERHRSARTKATPIEVRFESLSPRQQADIRDKLETWASNLARGARAENTVDALRRDLTLFTSWCRNTARVPLPASQETLQAFLQAHAESRKISTLKRYLASIATLHSAAGLSNPSKGEIVRSELDIIARNQARTDKAARKKGGKVRFEKRQAAPLREDDLVKADTLFGYSLKDRRDRAIVWMAFDTLMRASELAALRLEDLRRAPGGAMIATIRHSKSDQYGEGQMRYVSPFTVERLKVWLEEADITEGYVFRGLQTRYAEGGRGKKNKKRVTEIADSASRQVIYRAIKNCAARLQAEGLVQFDLSAYSAHSTRVGAAQEMLAAGLGMLAVQQSGGWKTDAMPAQYAKEIDALHGGSAQLAEKRGRTKKGV